MPAPLKRVTSNPVRPCPVGRACNHGHSHNRHGLCSRPQNLSSNEPSAHPCQVEALRARTPAPSHELASKDAQMGASTWAAGPGVHTTLTAAPPATQASLTRGPGQNMQPHARTHACPRAVRVLHRHGQGQGSMDGTYTLFRPKRFRSKAHLFPTTVGSFLTLEVRKPGEPAWPPTAHTAAPPRLRGSQTSESGADVG